MKTKITIRSIWGLLICVALLGCGAKETPSETLVATEDSSVQEESTQDETPEVPQEDPVEETEADVSEEEIQPEKQYYIDLKTSAEADYYYVDADGNRILGINVPPVLDFHTDEKELKEESRIDFTVYGDKTPMGYIYCVSDHNVKLSDIEFAANLMEYSESGEEFTLPFKNQYGDTWTTTVERCEDIEASNHGVVYTYKVKEREDKQLADYISVFHNSDIFLEIVLYDYSPFSNRLWSIDYKEFVTALIDTKYDWDIEYYVSEETNLDDWESYKANLRNDESVATADTEVDENDVPETEADTGSDNNSSDTTATNSTGNSSGSYIQLSNGTTVNPGGDVNLADLSGATFVIGGSETVWFAGIGSPGVYRLKEDPEPDWAFEAQYSPGTAVSLSSYASFFTDPSYDYLTIETRGSSDKEYSFHIVR